MFPLLRNCSLIRRGVVFGGRQILNQLIGCFPIINFPNLYKQYVGLVFLNVRVPLLGILISFEGIQLSEIT